MMADTTEVPRVVSASGEIAAGADRIFEAHRRSAQQPRWDGNDNLAEARTGQRVRGSGDVFTTTLSNGQRAKTMWWSSSRSPHRLVAGGPGREPPGHRWRWELEPVDECHTRVTHTYDWSELTDEKRLVRARATTTDMLQASLTRLLSSPKPGDTTGLAVRPRRRRQMGDAMMGAMTRDEITQQIVASRAAKGLTWQQLADAIDKPLVWTTSALLGHTHTRRTGHGTGRDLDLDPAAVPVLAAVPMRGGLPTAVPTDPTIYRFYEVLQVMAARSRN